jgi:hypothetical protein
MSSGGVRGTDFSGVTAMRIQDASDFTKQTKVRLVYQTFASTSGANAYLNETPNANDSYLQFLQGVKECSNIVACAGLPYQWSRVRLFR